MNKIENLETLLSEKYNLDVDTCREADDPWYRFTIKGKKFQAGNRGGGLYFGLYLAQIDLHHEFEVIDKAIEKVNQSDAIKGSILRLADVDSYFVIETIELLPFNESVEGLDSLINYMMETANHEAVFNVVVKYKEFM